jgi:dihydrofolate reductase
MPLVRVDSFGVSIDGFGAGLDQSLENPLGVRGPELMEWFFHTKVWREMNQLGGGEAGVDNDVANRAFAGVGAWILGRNMFGPVRGPWPDESWRGWWGESPPYHTPVFVLTHHARETLRMEGGTEFHFVTGGIHNALARAREAAGQLDIRVGGGVETIRQFLKARLMDRMHVALRPILLGSGESLWAGLDMGALGYACNERIEGERATHMFIERTA